MTLTPKGKAMSVALKPCSYPALSLDKLMTWMREVRANPNLLPSRKAVAYTLATYHNSSNGRTFPGLSRLASDTGLHRETVIAAYRDLEREGHLDHVERFDGRVRLSHQYTLKMKASNDDSSSVPADQPPTVEPTTPRSPEPTVTTKKNDITQRAVDALARRAQRLSDGKGWRMDRALETVAAALNRAGREAVERTILRLEEGPQRPAYELMGILGRLRRADTVMPGSGLCEGPKDAAYHRAASIHSDLFAGGVVDFSARIVIHRAVESAGIEGTRWWDRRDAIAAMAEAIRAGKLE
jgi:hypothetical protein